MPPNHQSQARCLATLTTRPGSPSMTQAGKAEPAGQKRHTGIIVILAVEVRAVGQAVSQWVMSVMGMFRQLPLWSGRLRS